MMSKTTLKPLILVPAALAAFALGACSSDDDTASSEPSCPTEVPAAGTKADWTLPGTTGTLDVVAPTDDKAPLVTVEGPFSVDQTTVKTLHQGNGGEVTEAMNVTVCYQGVNGRDGKTFDNAFERGEPAEFSPSGVVPGFAKALVGQKVGSTVAVAMTPADGYGPDGNPQAGIQGDDTLIFALQIVDGY